MEIDFVNEKVNENYLPAIGIKISNSREADVWIALLTETEPEFTPRFDIEKTLLKEKIKHINRCLQKRRIAGHRRSYITHRLPEIVSRCVVPDDAIKWLDKANSRQIYWFWLHLTEHLKLSSSDIEMPNSTFKIYKKCIEYLDLWGATVAKKVSVKNIKDKLNYLEDAEEDWKKVANLLTPYKFLNAKNERQGQWAWGYINDYIIDANTARSKRTARSQTTIRDKTITVRGLIDGLFDVNSQKERYLQCIAFLDVWPRIYEAEKELFLIMMKAAWNQKKYRDSLVDHVICNISLEKSVKKKLDILAMDNGKKINETVAWLIEKEFENRIYSND